MKTLKAIILLLGFGLFILFLCPLIFIGILNAGNLTGMLISVLIISYGFLFEKVNTKIKNLSKSKAGKIFLTVICVAVVVVLVFIIWATAKMARAADNPPTKETTVIVLGCQVKETGPSRMLRERLDAAYEYLTENPDAKCILSGGKGVDEPESEAMCMYKYLTARGIDEKRLYIEDKSTSTKENLTVRVAAENGATAGKFELAKMAKQLGLDAIHDTVHEMARDEARHGKAFEGLLERYFG